MAVEIIEALKPVDLQPPPLGPLVLSWRHGDSSWMLAFYTRTANETDLQAAQRTAKEEAATGHHVRILTVDEKA